MYGNGNGRPLGMRKRMQVVIAVILLAWATQTLLHQWGYGAEVTQSDGGDEKFVPGTERFTAGATLELRGDSVIFGPEVKLRQIARWSDADASVFAPVANLVVLHIDHGSPFRSITIDQLSATLHDAGMNLAMVKFAGPMSCTITRSDANYDEQSALQQWAQAKEGKDDAQTPAPADAEKTPPAAGPDSSAPHSAPAGGATEQSPVKTLRSLLIEDLAIRLGLSQDQLQVTFNPADEKLLNLSEPLFKFNIEARQVRDLGDVSWNVVLFTGSSSQKGIIKATARAWQNQVVLARPLAYGQVVQPDDVTEKRVLADRLPTDPLLNVSQVVGQQSARDLTVGSVVNARMVNGVPLVKPGQLVTITVTSGAVQVKTAGRAMEEGCYGQAIKVRNEETRDIFEVVMTGPQQGSMGPLPAPSTVAINSR